MASNKSQHILSTSANLLGFCLIVITSIHMGDRTSTTYADECSSFAAMLLVLSTLFSYLSIKSNSEKRATYLEQLADYTFLLSLVVIAGIVIFLFLNLSLGLF
ncbi:MAG: hypothetical protein KDC49_08040 [Saprospiraceae bacterium]|nr:hypothetical protein [Saprospiraceae bacterium]